MDDPEVAKAGDRLDPTMPGGIPLFLSTLSLLAILRIGLGYASLPLSALPVTNLVIAIIFLSAPIIALFFAANAKWDWRTAAWFVGGGLVIQIGLIGLAYAMKLPGPIAGILVAVSQGALACWCVGLGALLATLIKEKNIILPIAIFLAAYDFFLVLSPWGYGEKVMRMAAPVLTKVAAQIPRVSAAPTHGYVQPQAYVGMADFVFLGMFFIALFRFRMRTRQTLFAVVPALVLYMFVVIFLGGSQFLGFQLDRLPAMVPIGLAILAVNWPDFQLKRDEKVATAALAILAASFVVFVATRPKPQPEPLPRDAVPAPRGSAGSRAPTPPG